MNEIAAIVVAITFVAITSIIGVALGDSRDAIMIFGFSSVVCGQLITILRQITVEQKLKEVKDDVSTIEKATNSMKDALVQATGDAKFLEGKAAERKNPEPPHKPWVGE